MAVYDVIPAVRPPKSAAEDGWLRKCFWRVVCKGLKREKEYRGRTIITEGPDRINFRDCQSESDASWRSGKGPGVGQTEGRSWGETPASQKWQLEADPPPDQIAACRIAKKKCCRVGRISFCRSLSLTENENVGRWTKILEGEGRRGRNLGQGPQSCVEEAGKGQRTNRAGDAPCDKYRPSGITSNVRRRSAIVTRIEGSGEARIDQTQIRIRLKTTGSHCSV